MRFIRLLVYCLICLIVFVFATSLTIGFLLKDQSTVACPDVTGLDVQEARVLAEQRGLSLVIAKHEKKKDVPYNRVIFQRPDPAMPVRKGRPVSVVVSDGPQPVIVPAVTGRFLEEGQLTLQEQGIKVKKIIHVPSGEVGKILAQVPGSGKNILDEEGMVLIVGGKEKRYYVMPDITKDYAAAIDEMDRKHIAYRLTYTDGFDPAPRSGLRTNVLPRTIFSQEEPVELRMNGGG